MLLEVLLGPEADFEEVEEQFSDGSRPREADDLSVNVSLAAGSVIETQLCVTIIPSCTNLAELIFFQKASDKIAY